MRHVEVGCVLHDKIKLGLWRGDPSECDLTNVDLKPHTGEVLHFGRIRFTENFGIHLVLKGFPPQRHRLCDFLMNKIYNPVLLGSIKASLSSICLPLGAHPFLPRACIPYPYSHIVPRGDKAGTFPHQVYPRLQPCGH